MSSTANTSSVRIHLRRVVVAWFIGAGWMALAGGAVYFRFAKEMGFGQNRFLWGLLAAVPFLATVLQLPGSLWVERSGRNKWPFLGWLLFHRLCWMGIGVLPFVVLPLSWAAIFLVLLLVFVQSAAANIAGPPWTNWMAALIPPRIRGRFFGMRHRRAMVMFVAMSLLAGWLLNVAHSGAGVLSVPWPAAWNDWPLRPVCPFPFTPLQLCAMLFAVGSALGVIDGLCLLRIPDMGRPDATPAGGEHPTLRSILATPLRDRQFVRFLVFYSVFTIGAPGTTYYIFDYANKTLGVSDLGIQMIFLVLPVLGELTFAPVWGRLIDRFGRKTVWMISMAYCVLIPVSWLLVMPAYWWVAIIIPILGNVSWNGCDQCNTNWLLHLASGKDGSSSYQAVYALAVAITGAMSGLLLGLLAWLGRDIHATLGPFRFNFLLVVFGAATAIRAFAYIFLLPRVHDDSPKPVSQALRYVMTVVVDAIDSTVNFPLRLFGLANRPKNGGSPSRPRGESKTIPKAAPRLEE